MEQYLLPDDFFKNPVANDGIFLHHYHTTSECEKSRIILKDNTFSFLFKGQKQLYNENYKEHIESMQYLFMKSGNYLMSEKTTLENEYSSQLLFFDNNFLAEFIFKYPQLAAPKTQQQPAVLKGDIDEYILHFLKSISYIDPADVLAKKVKMEEILLYFIQNKGLSVADLLENQNKSQQLKIQEIVHNNLDNNLEVSELAFLCNMSVSTFKRHFKTIYHNSPIKWMQEKRLETAAQKLLQAEYKANDLYLETGYQSLSSFIQAFKQKFGQTPKQYQYKKLDV